MPAKKQLRELEPSHEHPLKLMKPPISKEAARIVAEMDDRAARMPSTFRASVPALSHTQLQFYCSMKGLPVRSGLGRVTKQAMIDSVLRALDEQVAHVALAKRGLTRASPKKAGMAEGKEEAEAQPHESQESFELDVGELEAGNDAPEIWARVRATLKLLVTKGQITAADAVEMESEIQAKSKNG